MNPRLRLLGLVLVASLAAPPAAAVQPDEVLDDPSLEARARDISADVRCLVCRSENIDSSNAAWAKDVRLVIRERLVAGDTDTEVKRFLTDRFGEYVLFTPPFSVPNAALWLSGPVLFVLGAMAAVGFMRRNRRVAPTAERPLNADEQAALDEILSRDDRV